MKRQSGFTLIELVVVIIILGILSAVAIPKFIDLSTEAGNAASKGVAGSLASASAVNYGAKLTGNASAVALNIANVCTDAIAGSLVAGVTFTATPANDKEYAMSGTGDCTVGAGTAVTCTITGFKGVGQDATLICTD